MLTPPSAPPDSTRATGAPPPAASQPQRPAPFWQARHPLWLCAFRPFFALTMLGSVGLVALWLLFLGAGWPLPAVPGGAVVWHVHELLLGVTLAAVAGFALTAVPEFTRTPAFAVRPVRQLAGWWLLGRLAFWLSGWWPTPALLVAGLAHLAFMLQLSALLLPRLWRDPGRRQLGFGWAMLALLVTIAGFHVDVLRGEYPMRWLHATLGVLMALIVVAMSRISMAIVNDAIDAQLHRRTGLHDEDDDTAYLARPPRRHLAVFCISLFTVMQWHAPDSPVTGWLALACAAALLNLLNDWHVGRALLRRWPLMLYASYVFMAAGYGLIGWLLLAGEASASPGLHLLTTGALGLSVYAVICIAGYTHSGLDKEGRRWVPLGAWLLVLAAIARALAGWWPDIPLLQGAGLLWCAAFGLQATQMLPVFLRPRADGAEGCAGVAEQTRRNDPAA